MTQMSGEPTLEERERALDKDIARRVEWLRLTVTKKINVKSLIIVVQHAEDDFELAEQRHTSEVVKLAFEFREKLVPFSGGKITSAKAQTDEPKHDHVETVVPLIRNLSGDTYVDKSITPEDALAHTPYMNWTDGHKTLFLSIVKQATNDLQRRETSDQIEVRFCHRYKVPLGSFLQWKRECEDRVQ